MARFWSRMRGGQPTSSNEAAAVPTRELNANDFTLFVANMNRLLGQLTSLTTFKGANISLLEWIALSLIAEKGALPSKTIAKALGVSRKSANKLTTSLSSSGFVSVKESKPGAVATITDAGKAKFAEANAALWSLVSPIVSGKERAFVGANKLVRALTQIGVPAVAKPAQKPAG